MIWLNLNLNILILIANILFGKIPELSTLEDGLQVLYNNKLLICPPGQKEKVDLGPKQTKYIQYSVVSFIDTFEFEIWGVVGNNSRKPPNFSFLFSLLRSHSRTHFKRPLSGFGFECFCHSQFYKLIFTPRLILARNIKMLVYFLKKWKLFFLTFQSKQTWQQLFQVFQLKIRE